jgi:hypothetical protein
VLALGSGFTWPMIRFMQILQLFNRLRYINTYFGKILSSFLEATGTISDDQTKNYNELENYGMGKWKGKMNKYSVHILFTNAFLLKTCLYLLSFLAKIFSEFLVRRMISAQKVNVRDCKIVYFTRKIHLLIFTIFLVDMSFYTARSIAHVKNYGSSMGGLNFFGGQILLVIMIIDLFSLFDTGNRL